MFAKFLDHFLKTKKCWLVWFKTLLGKGSKKKFGIFHTLVGWVEWGWVRPGTESSSTLCTAHICYHNPTPLLPPTHFTANQNQPPNTFDTHCYHSLQPTTTDATHHHHLTPPWHSWVTTMGCICSWWWWWVAAVNGSSGW